ncbi:MAG: hypothetical protein L0K76_06200 [Lentilactobacillus parabuchneri]|nr:hypothetical protein [Lentilactobacillus parabuchneri]
MIAYGYIKQVPVLANSVGATFISMMIAAVIYYVVSRLVYRNQLQED